MKKLILIGMLLVASNLLAQTAATVLFTVKKVVASHNGVERTLSRGSSLDAGDSVITSDGALVNIQYLNGALVNIGANSHYTIIAYSPKSSAVQIKAELNIGKVHIKTAGKVKETLKTPIVSLAILGTDLDVAVVCPIAMAVTCASPTTLIQVNEGTVQARNMFLTPGSSVRVTPHAITNATFPKEQLVAPPRNAPGSISTGANGTSTSTTSTSTTTTTYETTDSSASVTGTLAVVDTSLVTGTTSTSTSQVTQNTVPGDISIICSLMAHAF